MPYISNEGFVENESKWEKIVYVQLYHVLKVQIPRSNAKAWKSGTLYDFMPRDT